MNEKSVRLKPKFKVGDIVAIKLLPDIYTKLKECGIVSTDTFYNSLLLDTGVVIETNANNILPYLIWFKNTEKKFYLPEELLEPHTTKVTSVLALFNKNSYKHCHRSKY